MAASRETVEETGIEASFAGVLGIREIYDEFRDDTADLNIVCLMRLNEDDSTQLKPCVNELEACQWLTFDQLKSEKVHYSA